MPNQIDLSQINGSANANVNGQILFANVVSGGQGGLIAADPNWTISNSGGATPITTMIYGSTTSNGYRMVLQSNTGVSNDAYVEFVSGVSVAGYVGTQGASGDLVAGVAQGGDLILAIADGSVHNVYIKAATGGAVIVNGNIFMGGDTQSGTGANAVLVFEGTNSTQIVINSQGPSWGVIANPNNQTWCLGVGGTSTNTMPTANVLSWAGSSAGVGGPWVGITGGSAIATPNGSTFTVGGGRAILTLQGAAASNDALISFQNSTGFVGGYIYGSNTELRLDGQASSNLTFYSGAAQAAQFDSVQRMQIGGTTSSPGSGGTHRLAINFTGAGTEWGITLLPGGNTTHYIDFMAAGGNVIGAITGTSSNVVYGFGSDYRLKANVNNMTGGLANILALQPRNWEWNHNKEPGRGFVAHELQEIIPEAVWGEKDGVFGPGEAGPEGEMKMQLVDFSKIVPHLVSAIQEQQNMILELKQEIKKLKSNN